MDGRRSHANNSGQYKGKTTTFNIPLCLPIIKSYQKQPSSPENIKKYGKKCIFLFLSHTVVLLSSPRNNIPARYISKYSIEYIRPSFLGKRKFYKILTNFCYYKNFHKKCLCLRKVRHFLQLWQRDFDLVFSKIKKFFSSNTWT